jgi:urea ABC transporter ATP-binding protein UrtE
MLEIKDLSVSYGRVEVLHNVSLSVNEGEIVCIIGANGAGKTTLLNTISGFNKRKKESILFNAAALPTEPTQVTRGRIIHVPEGRKIFPGLSVAENLILGGYTTPQNRIQRLIKEVYELFPILGERQNQRAGTLSGGEQQMLAIGRALLTKPKVLMFDEPTEGIQPSIVLEIEDAIRRIRTELGLAVLLVEQYLDFAERLADAYVIMAKGAVVAGGPTAQLRLETVRHHLAV